MCAHCSLNGVMSAVVSDMERGVVWVVDISMYSTALLSLELSLFSSGHNVRSTELNANL